MLTRLNAKFSEYKEIYTSGKKNKGNAAKGSMSAFGFRAGLDAS